MIGGDAILSFAIAPRDGLFPRRGVEVESAARLLGGLKVLESLKVSGRGCDQTTDALCSGSSSSVSHRCRFAGLTWRCAGMMASWCAVVCSRLVRLRFNSRPSSSVDGVGGSSSSQEEMRLVFSAKTEADAGDDAVMMLDKAMGKGDVGLETAHGESCGLVVLWSHGVVLLFELSLVYKS